MPTLSCEVDQSITNDCEEGGIGKGLQDLYSPEYFSVVLLVVFDWKLRASSQSQMVLGPREVKVITAAVGMPVAGRVMSVLLFLCGQLPSPKRRNR